MKRSGVENSGRIPVDKVEPLLTSEAAGCQIPPAAQVFRFESLRPGFEGLGL